MTDSLVIGGIIELLGGGVPSMNPQCVGAYFYLGTGFDLSAPQMTSEQTASLLLDGEVITGFRASNRAPTIPVVMGVPSTGDHIADRLTLAGARELLLQTTAQDSWELIWTREGAEPLILDCMGLSSVVVHYSVLTEQGLFSLVDVSFAAFPYGRSDTQELIQFNSPSQQFPPPPTTVLIDDFGSTVGAANFLTGDASTFDTTIANWVGAGNSTIARVTTPVHSGAGALRLTSVASGDMFAAHSAAPSPLIDSPTGAQGAGLKCNAGDSITAKGWFRSAVSARTCKTGANFFDSSGTQIGGPLTGSGAADTTSAYTQVTSTGLIAPSGTAYARLLAQVVSTGAANEQHFFDDGYLDRGPVFSADNGSTWTKASVTAFGSFSAHWSRQWHSRPLYDHVLPAPVDITGRPKFSFWFGLSTPSNQWPVWHRGTVSFAVTLYDSAGNKNSFGFKRTCHASALVNSPHWQSISAHIPQVASGFDFTTISRWSIKMWSRWDANAVTSTGSKGQEVLQADAYLNLVQAQPTSVGTVGTRGAFYQLPGIVGTARTPLAIQAAPGTSSFSSVAEFTTPGSNNWTAPTGVTHVDKEEGWGAGAGGAGAQPGHGGGGGGAGEYVMELNVPVTPLTVYHPFVGAGGTGGTGGGNQGQGGGDSFFSGDSGRQLYAHGGDGGWQSTAWGGGKGGDGSQNYAHYPGGDGRQSNAAGDDHGGGGGSSGGPGSAGKSAGNYGNGRGGAPAVFDGGPGGDGGFSGVNTAPASQGKPPTTGPGGGGGGGSDDGSGYLGATGANGKIRLTFGAAGILPLQSLALHIPPRDAPDAFNPLCPITATDVPNGATEYLIPDIGNLNARYDGTYTMFAVLGTVNTPSASRDITIQLRQYPYPGGTALTQNIPRQGLVPSTDLLGTQTIVDMGPVTLPLSDIPPGSLSPYFGLTITDTNTSDRFLDVFLVDTKGTFILVNVGSISVFNNIWVDQPDTTRQLGRILGSNLDRDQAVSALQYAERFSGGPLAVYPNANNRLFVYSAQGLPGITAFYPPQWWTERLQ
jgi:hypothetical protein